MADEPKPEIELAPDEVALISAHAFIDRDGDPIACVVIGGLTYARLEHTLEEAMATAQHTIDTLLRFQRSATVRKVGIMNVPTRDGSKEN
jgi:hypothetical protein